MKLLVIIAAVLVAWFLLKKRSGDAGAAASIGSTSPDEIDYLNEADLPAQPPAPEDPGSDIGSYTPLANAIANAEGFGPGANIPTRANNPGDLELGDVGFGTIAARGGNQITVFRSAADGWTALNNQIAKIFSGRSRYYRPDMSLTEFGSIYSGGSPSYGESLANFLGTTSAASLSQANAGS